MNIIANNRDTNTGFGKADGIYNYIHNDLYKNSNGYELKKLHIMVQIIGK